MSNYSTQEEEGISLSKLIALYTSHWKWFALSVFIALISAFVYLRYATPRYDTLTTILINDPSEGRGLSELAAFSDLGAFSDMGSNDVNDEIEIIKSKTLISNVVVDLGVNISQYAKGDIKNSSIYKKSPLKVEYKWKEIYIEDLEKPSKSYEVSILSDSQLNIVELSTGDEKTASFNDNIEFEGGFIKVAKSAFFEKNMKKEEPLTDILIKVFSVSNYTERLQQSIQVSPKSKRSSVIDIILRSTDKLMARDILNRLVYQYNQQAVDDKNLVSQNTSNFIAERLDIISKELDNVEYLKASFKKDNNLTDLESEAVLVVGQAGEAENKQMELQTQLSLTEYMIAYLKEGERSSDLIPSDIGINNLTLNRQILNYNELVLERDRLLEVSTSLNPLVVNLDANIKSHKLNLLESLKNQKSNIQISIRDMNKQKGRINSKISSLPQQEKDFRVIERKQTIKETLYLFLLEKREETSISMAVTAPVAKIIDKAYSTASPVSPKKKIIFLTVLILGIVIPFGIIYFKDMLDTKVNEKSDIELVLSDVPVLVEAPKINKGDSDMLAPNDRSVLGESFRILRTNLNYFAKNKKRKDKALRVFVTSTVKGEGKTFISFNTILSLADASKKVLVVGADIRNPQLHRYFSNDKDVKGLSEYLYDDELSFDDVLSSSTINNHQIDYVAAGRIPPNPSELLMNGRLELLLDQAEDHYDYIIVDTAPTMLVTDTLLLTETADVTLYVVRAGYTEKELLNFPKSLVKDEKIKNLAIVLNDVDQGKVGYGYGYGYGAEQKTFWQKIFKK